MKQSILILLPAFLLNLNEAGALGWPQPKGHGFFKLDYTSIRARQFYSLDGNIYDINGAGTRLGYHTLAFYGEYGLSQRLTAIAYVPFLVRNTVNEGIGAITGEVLQPGLENTAFGDVDLGLRLGLLKTGPWVLSATAMLGIHTGEADNPDLLHTGDGEANQLLSLEWGYGQRRWYATGAVGINNRTEGFSEEFRYHLEAGYWLLPSQLLVAAKLAGIESFQNGNPTGSTNGLFSNNVEYLSPQLALTYEYREKWGVSAQIAGAVLGRNVLAAPSISVGIHAKF